MTMIEETNGLPGAGELEALANELFPDLVGGYGESILTGDVPAVYPDASGTGIGSPAVPEANADVPSFGYGTAPGIDMPEFDWEHPFAYGGASSDPWLKEVEGAAAPEAEFLHSESDVPKEAAPASGYAPVVLSQHEAQEQERKIDAPTSLGGDSVAKKKRTVRAVFIQGRVHPHRFQNTGPDPE